MFSYDLVTVLKVPVLHKLRREDTSLVSQGLEPLQNSDYRSRIGSFSTSVWLVVARITETSVPVALQSCPPYPSYRLGIRS